MHVSAERSLKKGTEIFTNYGEYTGSELLAEWGFLADDNPFDFVSVDMHDLEAACVAEVGESARSKCPIPRSELPESLEFFRLEEGLDGETERIVRGLCGNQASSAGLQ